MDIGAKVTEPPNIMFLEFYMHAFNELCTCRSASHIPFTAIVEYANIYSIEDFEEFLYVIRVMENKLIVLKDKDGKDGSKKPKANNKGRRG